MQLTHALEVARLFTLLFFVKIKVLTNLKKNLFELNETKDTICITNNNTEIFVALFHYISNNIFINYEC